MQSTVTSFAVATVQEGCPAAPSEFWRTIESVQHNGGARRVEGLLKEDCRSGHNKRVRPNYPIQNSNVFSTIRMKAKKQRLGAHLHIQIYI